jgi:hypothetical protein
MSMRKALIGLILAATAMTPVAAGAQRGRDRDGDSPRVHNQDGGSRGEGRAARAEQRQQAREERQAAQPAPQPQVQAQPQVQVVQRDRGGNRGGSGDGNRNWRGNNDNNAGNNNRGGDRGNGWQGRQRTNQPSIYPQAWQGDPNDPRLRNYQELERRNQQRTNDGRRGDDRRDWRNDRNDGRNWRNGDRDGRRNNWNRSWRNDNRYDWQRWRYSNRNIFRIGPYYSPYRGYGYNRFDIGIFLEPLFYSQRYWIGDPWQYRLPPAYPGTQWVRYYNDVILVDVYSGEVLDVIYDFFW